MQYYEHLANDRSLESRHYMNIHYLRLSTFKDWPRSEIISPLLLASSGFYYTQTDDEVECFSCEGRVRNWRRGDKPNEVHHRRFPLCQFINDQDRNNVPWSAAEPISRSRVDYQGLIEALQNAPTSISSAYGTTTVYTTTNLFSPGIAPANGVTQTSLSSEGTDANTSTNTSSTHQEDISQSGPEHTVTRRNYQDQLVGISLSHRFMLDEANRLATFTHWSFDNPVAGEDLAGAGFFFTHISDRVQCAFCHGILRNWEAGDSAMGEHERFFPNCPFVQGYSERNMPLQNVPSASSRADLTTGPTGMPRHPGYTSEVSRLQTYKLWPTQIQQKPELLAQAGFFYTGHADNVRCYYCDGELRNWSIGEDPWIEHARWFSKCAYLIFVKGEDFIKKIENAKNEKLSKQGKETKEDGKNGKGKEKVQQREIESETGESNIEGSTTNHFQDLKEEIDSLRQQLRVRQEEGVCRICMEQEACIVFLPCGHLGACSTCSPALRNCAFCRTSIRGTVRIYFA